MLRLCIVNPFEREGGAEYQISLLIDALAARERWEIHYLTHFVADEGEPRNYQVSRIGSGGRVPRFGYMMEAPALYRKLRDIGPSVIYQRVACGYTAVCAYYARKRSIPLVWHVAHDTDVTSQVLDSGRNILRLRLEKEAVKYGARHATGIVVQTAVQAGLLEKHYGRQAAAVIPNFQPSAGEVIDKSGPLTIVWVANLKRWKRPEVFIRLARAFAAHRDVRFVMVGAPAQGGGDASWQKSLMDDIQGAAQLAYWGKRSQADVNELLSKAHILVNSSVHEGFPNTFIQAWMREVAVVSLSVDPDGVLERERLGIVAGSEEGLAAAIRSLLSKPELLAAYGQAGRNYATLNHSLKNADRLASLMESYARGGCG